LCRGNFVHLDKAVAIGVVVLGGAFVDPGAHRCQGVVSRPICVKRLFVSSASRRQRTNAHRDAS
jgi:hypothetical protein